MLLNEMKINRKVFKLSRNIFLQQSSKAKQKTRQIASDTNEPSSSSKSITEEITQTGCDQRLQ